MPEAGSALPLPAIVDRGGDSQLSCHDPSDCRDHGGGGKGKRASKAHFINDDGSSGFSSFRQDWLKILVGMKRNRGEIDCDTELPICYFLQMRRGPE
jgi:hypothetical protein